MRTLLITMFALGCGKDNSGIVPGGGGGTANTLPDDPPPGSTGGDTGQSSDDTGGVEPTDDTGSSPANDTSDTAPPDDNDDTGEFTIDGTGWSNGDIAYNLSVMDASGAPYALHDLYGSKIVLMVGNLDVATTVDTMNNMNTTAGDHSGVTFLAFIGRGADGVHCDQTCAASVSSTYGTSQVQVLFESSSSLSTHSEWIQLQNTRTYLIDSSMEIDWTKNGTVNAAQLDSKIDDLSR
jgi:hypothetical protein